MGTYQGMFILPHAGFGRSKLLILHGKNKSEHYCGIIRETNKERDMVLKIGQRAPDFKLPSQLGTPVTLSDHLGKNVVLAFFPLAWTPV
jgi:cytochrome oxidase Cu insertion factor (SCO1/SenC/PrrC family)